MNVIIFDDNNFNNFFPLTLTRPISELRVGILKLRQRILGFLELETAALLIEKRLENYYKERHPAWVINEIEAGKHFFVNSRLKINDACVYKIRRLKTGQCLICKGTVVAAKLNFDTNKKISCEELNFDNLEKIEFCADFWNYPWELVNENAKYIDQDFENFFYETDNYFETETGVTVLNPYSVWIGQGTTIGAGTVIDASNGAVVIDEDTKIMPNCVIIGPVYIGKNSVIKAAAKIYEGTSIGPVCKVGGEVEETIIQGYSNKQHDGFLGHSYLGEWVNLGADTNNSDLKNNYKNVKVYNYPAKTKIDSGTMFAGCFIGDHSKLGINSSINTGTVIGCCCNIWGLNLVEGYIKDFSWGTYGDFVEYKPEKFIETASLVKQRRQLDMGKHEKELYKQIIKYTT